jgi:hypothetical protein
MKSEIHKCRATSRVISLLTAIAEMIGQLEGVKLQTLFGYLGTGHVNRL